MTTPENAGWVERNGRWLLGAALSSLVLTFALAHGCKSGAGTRVLNCTFDRVHKFLPKTRDCLQTTEYKVCLDNLARRIGEDTVLCAAERIADYRLSEGRQAAMANDAQREHEELLQYRANNWLIYRYSR